MDFSALAAQAIQLLQASRPALFEKAAGAAATAVASTAAKDLWSYVKTKLSGKEAVAKVETEPDKSRNWDRLRADLEEALESDAPFREELVKRLAAFAGAGAQTQTAVGDRNQQISVQHSSGVTISVNKPD